MLQAIRDHASGWIAWVVFGLISIPFALWGINQYFGNGPNPVVATVDGTKITLSAFQRTLERQRERLEASRPGLQIDDHLLRQRVLDGMINNLLLQRSADSGGMRVSDAELASVIRGAKPFQSGGRFSKAAYQAWLRNQGFTAPDFESELRRDLLIQQISAGIGQSGMARAASATALYSLLREERSFAVLRIAAKKFSALAPDDAQIKKYYEAHQGDFRVPEQVVLDYVVLSRKAIAKRVPVTDAELRQLYQSEKARFVTHGERRIAHILIKLPAHASKAQIEAATKKLDALRQKILAGSSFAEMAKKFSQDAGSAQDGGDLGFFPRGVLGKAIDKVAFALKKGQVSEPVRTPSGMHLIEVEAIKRGHQKSFDDVKATLRSQYQMQHADALFYADQDKLANLSFEHPDSLKPVAEALGLKVQQTGKIARDGASAAGVFRNPKLLHAAFASDVLAQGNNSAPIDLGDGRVVVLRVKQHFPPKELSLAEVRGRIETLLQARLEAKAAKRQGEALLAKLRAGAQRAAVATQAGANWKRFEDLRRNASGVDPSLLETVFRMPTTKLPKVEYDAVAQGDGDFAIVALEGVKRPSTGQSSAKKDVNLLRDELAQANGAMDFKAYVQALRDAAKITVHKKVLNGAS